MDKENKLIPHFEVREQSLTDCFCYVDCNGKAWALIFPDPEGSGDYSESEDSEDDEDFIDDEVSDSSGEDIKAEEDWKVKGKPILKRKNCRFLDLEATQAKD